MKPKWNVDETYMDCWDFRLDGDLLGYTIRRFEEDSLVFVDMCNWHVETKYPGLSIEEVKATVEAQFWLEG